MADAEAVDPALRLQVAGCSNSEAAHLKNDKERRSRV
jgi:hypothetical protein